MQRLRQKKTSMCDIVCACYEGIFFKHSIVKCKRDKINMHFAGDLLQNILCFLSEYL